MTVMGQEGGGWDVKGIGADGRTSAGNLAALPRLAEKQQPRAVDSLSREIVARATPAATARRVLGRVVLASLVVRSTDCERHGLITSTPSQQVMKDVKEEDKCVCPR
jgi:hypothetical protein